MGLIKQIGNRKRHFDKEHAAELRAMGWGQIRIAKALGVGVRRVKRLSGPCGCWTYAQRPGGLARSSGRVSTSDSAAAKKRGLSLWLATPA